MDELAKRKAIEKILRKQYHDNQGSKVGRHRTNSNS